MQMVLACLVESTSKADTIRVMGELGVDPVGLRTLLRSLRRCQERDYRDSIQAALHSHITANGDLSLVPYDVTTLYLVGPTGRTSYAKWGTPRRGAWTPGHRRDAHRPYRFRPAGRLLGGQQGRD